MKTDQIFIILVQISTFYEILRINNEMYNPKPGSRFLSDFVVVAVTVELMVDWRSLYDCCDQIFIILVQISTFCK
jgi:hypothetical protein